MEGQVAGKAGLSGLRLASWLSQVYCSDSVDCAFLPSTFLTHHQATLYRPKLALRTPKTLCGYRVFMLLQTTAGPQGLWGRHIGTTLRTPQEGQLGRPRPQGQAWGAEVAGRRSQGNRGTGAALRTSPKPGSLCSSVETSRNLGWALTADPLHPGPPHPPRASLCLSVHRATSASPRARTAPHGPSSAPGPPPHVHTGRGGVSWQ